MPADVLSTSAEDYLKAVYLLTRSAPFAATTDMAVRLSVSAPSVTGMVRRLADQGLVDHVPYRGVSLTAAGMRAALAVVRRHRILETYLVERLGLGWDEVHAEAERLEHAVSDRVLERMSQALGHPEFDPHGDPIPDAGGTLPTRMLHPLTTFADGARVTLRQVLDDDAERLRQLAAIGLVPGSRMAVLEGQTALGLVRLDTEGGERVIGVPLASVLLCDGEPLAAPAVSSAVPPVRSRG
jgi:DtxR family transcriptional regulator, Mn-dependent transcriptional regulator